MSRSRARRWHAAMVAAVTVTALVAVIGSGTPKAGADTDPSTLSGQGGSFLEPVVSKLLIDDAGNMSPLFGAYTSTGIDAGIAAFIGSGPSQFAADFAVSERPLTPSEQATAKANGRSFAYVPFAETPVAVATLVPTETWAASGSTTITSHDFCEHMPLTTDLLGEIFGFDAASPLDHWNDPRITCPPGGAGGAPQLPIAKWANLDPSSANSALMTLLDSTPTSKAFFDAGLNEPGFGSLTTDDTPSENWPYGQNTIPGGDNPLIGKLLAISSQTNAPSQTAATWQLGAIAPISSVWTGAPLGVPWNLMTAAIQNADGQFVVPSTSAAQAAAAHVTLASTSDQTTNNLVTFDASTSDPSAYNSNLMEESYLVVPTNGLSAAKAAALAQFVRFVLGPKGQADIGLFGAAPATSAMVASGLKVATQLNVESVTVATQANVAGSATTTTTAATGAGAPTTPADASGPTGSGTGSDSSGSTDSGLAFTGAPDVGVLVSTGAVLVLLGTVIRRRLRHREVR